MGEVSKTARSGARRALETARHHPGYLPAQSVRSGQMSDTDPISAYNNNDARITMRPFEPAVEFDIWLIRPKAARSFNLIDRFVEHALAELQDFADGLVLTA